MPLYMHSLVSCRTAKVTCTRLISAARARHSYSSSICLASACYLCRTVVWMAVEAGPAHSRYPRTAQRPSSCMRRRRKPTRNALPPNRPRAHRFPISSLSNPIGHLASQGNTTAWQIIESYTPLPDVSLALLPLPLAYVTSHNNVLRTRLARCLLACCNRATKRVAPCLAVPPCYTLQPTPATTPPGYVPDLLASPMMLAS
jgi:hypothetical protein